MFTVITGFFDIGREKWSHYTRPLNHYLFFFCNMLHLQVSMVIFTEERFIPFVRKIRDNIPFKTTIISKKLTDLYMYRYYDLLYEIQKDSNYGINHPHPQCPEIAEPLYALTVVSKLDLLKEGCQYALNDYCIWLDAGYTHGTINLSQYKWNPESLYNIKDRISLILLRPLSNMISDDPLTFSNQYIDIISGGFIGGYKNTIYKVHKLYYDLVDDILKNKRIKEDDQFYWTLLIKQNLNLFHLIPGGWYDALKIQ